MSTQVKLQTIIRATLANIFLGLLCATFVSSCVLSPFAPPPICERFWEGESVALVEVVNIAEHRYDRRVTLHLIDVYRGQPPSEIAVNDQRSDCGVNFPSKGRYLVWLSRTKSGKWQAYGDRTEEVADDLRYAKSMKNPSKTGRIYGTLDKPKHNLFVPSLNRVDNLPDRRGVTVIAENERERFKATVQEDLGFDLSAPSPGKYRISVEGLPPNLTVDSKEIDVHGGGCNELTMFSASSASISGNVQGTGQMPRFAQIFLIPANQTSDAKPWSSPWVLTDYSTGSFSFPHVEPGRYVLAFEFGHSPTLNVPYASRFFPQGSDPQNAAVIEVHAAERITNLKFDIGGEVARRHVQVRVSWPDGSPAINATAYLRDAHNRYSSLVADEQTPTDANGEALLEGFVDTDYDVAANAVCKGRSVSREVETKVISASAADAFVKLTIKGRKCPLVNWRPIERDE